MNIHEYQAKQLFERFGVATPKGIAATTAQEAAQVARDMGVSQYVVKAQVHAGGRGKGTFKNGFKGGVHVVNSVEEVEDVAGKMLNQVLVTKQTGEAGKLVSKIMVAEAVDLKKECYFAILQDRARECPVIVASTEGGMDIEEVAAIHPEAIIREHIDPALGILPFQALKIASPVPCSARRPSSLPMFTSSSPPWTAPWWKSTPSSSPRMTACAPWMPNSTLTTTPCTVIRKSWKCGMKRKKTPAKWKPANTT